MLRYSGLFYPHTAEKSDGFSLLEVMIALSIMAIVLVSVYRMHSQTISMSAESRFQTEAPLLAQSKLADLESDTDAELASDAGDFGDTYPGYTWKIDVEEISSEILGEISEDLKRIDVSVVYNDGERIYSLRTYRFRR